MRGRWIAVVCAATAVIAGIATGVAVTRGDDPASGWGPVHTIDDARARASSAAVGPDGTTLAVWARTNPGGMWSLMAAERPADGAWGEPQQVIAPQPWGIGRLSVVVNARGDAAIALVMQNRVRSVVQGAYRPAGGGWEASQTLSHVTHDPYDPRLALDDAGNVTVAWLSGRLPAGALRISHRPVAGGWRDPVVVPDAGGEWAVGPWVVPAAAGGAHVFAMWRPPPAAGERVAATTGLLAHVEPDGRVRTVARPAMRGADGLTAALAPTPEGPALAWAQTGADGASVLRARIFSDSTPGEPVVLERSRWPIGVTVGGASADGAGFTWTTWSRPWRTVRVRAAVLPASGAAPETVTLDEFDVRDLRDQVPANADLVLPGPVTGFPAAGPGAALWEHGDARGERPWPGLRAAGSSTGAWRDAGAPLADDVAYPGPRAAAEVGDRLVVAWAATEGTYGVRPAVIAGATFRR